jgi:16S rRNA (guanine527-N7)-methyltransferase
VVDQLVAIFERARSLGFLGPGPVEDHLEHSLSYLGAWGATKTGPTRFLDLGAGGGVPGLVLATRWPQSLAVLLDVSAKRCEFLHDAVATLGIADTVTVRQARAEVAARTEELEGIFALVTARSFGPPAVTAECAARFLAPSGQLLVAEPPVDRGAADRWPADGLAVLGLGPAAPTEGGRHLVRITRIASCPDRFPRRDGVPAKRPLF